MAHVDKINKPLPESPKFWGWDGVPGRNEDYILGQMPDPILKRRPLDYAANQGKNPETKRRDSVYIHEGCHSESTEPPPSESEASEAARRVSARGVSQNANARRNGSLSRARQRSDLQIHENSRQEVLHLEAELSKANRNFEDLAIACAKLRDERDQIRDQWGKAAEEMHKSQIRSHHHLDEQFFKGEWRKLRWQIKNCAELCFGDPIPLTRLTQRLKSSIWSKSSKSSSKNETIKFLSGEYKDYLIEDETRPLLMQALIWQVLCDEIFSSEDLVAHNKWTESKGKSFQELARALRPENVPSRLKEYHQWRADTSQLLHHAASASKVAMAKTLKEQLYNMTLPWLTTFETTLKGHLETIIGQALNLDADMQRQTAFYYVKTWKLCHPQGIGGNPIPTHPTFDPDHMEDNGASSSSRRYGRVSLIISPALMKTGNNEGEGYHNRYPVCKASVMESGSRYVPRSLSRLSNAGHDIKVPSGQHRNTNTSRSASAMSSTARRAEGDVTGKSAPPGSRGTISKPPWRQPGVPGKSA